MIERCATGRLRDTYPVHSHDVEVRFSRRPTGEELTSELVAVTRNAFADDPQCRRVVFAPEVGDQAALDAATAAGFRYVVDVDIPGGELVLCVAEPDWITELDTDRVPGT